MRLDLSFSVLFGCMAGLIIVLLLSRTKMQVTTSKLFVLLMVALTMPALLPGHGEFVLLLPSSALFFESSSLAVTLGFIYLIVNYVIAWFVLVKIMKLFSRNR